ncbi:hypothetical protein H9P43_008910 [Blastocladiella emersonii ATCC 22665]|nr:hypothetical protein H9P43_008910 [Blastocladiella emersonii ATCC 22665]
MTTLSGLTHTYSSAFASANKFELAPACLLDLRAVFASRAWPPTTAGDADESGAIAWWDAIDFRPRPSPHLAVNLDRVRPLLVQACGGWPDLVPATNAELARLLADQLLSDPVVASVMPVRDAELRVTLRDYTPLLDAMVASSALARAPPASPTPFFSSPKSSRPTSPAGSSAPTPLVYLYPTTSPTSTRGTLLAAFLARLSGAPGTMHPPSASASPTPAPALEGKLHHLLRALPVMTAPGGTKLVDCGADAGVAVLFSRGNWTPLAALVADLAARRSGTTAFLVCPVGCEAAAGQVVALLRMLDAPCTVRVVAYVESLAAGTSEGAGEALAVLAANRRKPLAGSGSGSGSGSRANEWACIRAACTAASTSATARPSPRGSTDSAATAEAWAELAFTLAQYPSVLHRCARGAESSPLATYAVRAAKLALRATRRGTTSANTNTAAVARAAAEVLEHAAWVLAGDGADDV